MVETSAVQIVALSVQRPIFRGDKAAVWTASVARLRELAAGWNTGLTVVAEPVIDARSAVGVAEHVATLRPDIVIVQATTFATADCFRPVLDLGLPTVLWAVAEPQLGGPLPLNSLCGVNFVRSLDGDGWETYWLYDNDEESFCRLRDLVTAVRAGKALQSARILALGGTAPTFTAFEADVAAVRGRFGVTVETAELDEWFAEIKRVDDAAAVALAEELAGEAEECADAAALLPAARVDLALRRLVLDRGYDAVALRCWPECADRTGAMPCAAVARLFDAGRPGACEGDLLGAVSLLGLKYLSGRDPVLLDLSHLDESGAVFWHCGNGPRSLADGGRTRIRTHFNRPDTWAVREMAIAPGPATQLRFADLGSASLFDGCFQAAEPAFDGISGRLAEVRWAGVRPLTGRELVATVLERRLPHHFAFVPGHLCSAARLLCHRLGLQLVEPFVEEG